MAYGKKRLPDARDLLTPEEFAERCATTAHTVRRWARDGYIKAKKVGPRKWLIPVSELERLLKME
jgi:excisionase family DNA binding protein